MARKITGPAENLMNNVRVDKHLSTSDSRKTMFHDKVFHFFVRRQQVLE